MFIDEYEQELDKEFMLNSAQKLVNTIKANQQQAQENYNKQINDFLEYARKKEMIRRARVEEQKAQVQINTEEAQKQIEKLFDFLK